MTDIVKVELSELGDLVERKLALEDTVRNLTHDLKHDWRLKTGFDETKERERRRAAIQEIKDGYARRIEEAEAYAEAPIEDKRTVALNALAAAMLQVSNVRRQIKALGV